MSGDTSIELELHTSYIVNTLTTKQTEISWASSILTIYKIINDLYGIFNCVNHVTLMAKELIQKVKELEKYITTNLELHITLKNSNTPLYLTRTIELLQRIEESCTNNISNGSFKQSTVTEKHFSHLCADVQALCIEYGFCYKYEAVYQVEETATKIEALLQKLRKIEGLPFHEPEVIIQTLNDVVATFNAIKQAMTQHNIDKMKTTFDDMTKRLTDLETTFCNQHLKEDCRLLIEYAALQFMVQKPSVQAVCSKYSQKEVNDHMIHPGTRGWILDKVNKFVHTTQKRIYYITGKQGTGKTALCSAICKLQNNNVIASHFFKSSLGFTVENRIIGLVLSLAGGMCHSLPEYVNWIDDKYCKKTPAEIAQSLKVPWEEAYDMLLREPIQELFGCGRSYNSHIPRKLIVIDGVDEMYERDYEQFKKFVLMFVTDLSMAFCMLITVRSKKFSSLIDLNEHIMVGTRFEDRTNITWHIKDLEIYLSTSLGAVLSGEDEMDIPDHAKADDTTLQKTVDELLKSSAGRFDFAVQLMEAFATEFSVSGQFLGSLRKCAIPLRNSVGNLYDQKMIDFASPYRSYRDKEGRSVKVRVMRQSQYLMDKTRVALIRGRHQRNSLENAATKVN